MQIITRFPPSPTGNLHIGGARTALFNYLFTKKLGGKMYLRLENTDEERSKPEYEQNIFDSLQWLNLVCDPLPDGKTFWRQSEREEIYSGYLKKMVESGTAYISKEDVSDSPFSKGSTGIVVDCREGEGILPFVKGVPPSSTGRDFSKSSGLADSATSFKKGGMKRPEVIRFKNPNKKVAFEDLVRGHIEFDTTELGDMVIARSLTEPLYHLAVVIDDSEMGVTHVIRGEDGVSNTARQILLQEALGFVRPQYAHIPLILAPDRSKLSKRHGAVSVTEYRDKGFLPEAVINYLALLGWNPGTEQELFTLDELIEKFDLAKVQKGGAIFSEEKLRWVNKEYLKKAGTASVIPHIPPELTAGRSASQIQALAEMLSERISVYGDIKTELTDGEYDYLLKKPVYPMEMLRWKKAKSEPKGHLENVVSTVEKISPEGCTVSGIKEALFPYAEAKGKGDVLWPTRVALSGKEQSPDPFTLAAILGKEETLARLQNAITMLKLTF